MLVAIGSTTSLVLCAMQTMLLSLLHPRLPLGACSIHVSRLLTITKVHPSIMNATKTQHIKFYKSLHPVTSSLHSTSLGQSLSLKHSVNHLVHILTFNLSDDEEISAITKDMCCTISYTFSNVVTPLSKFTFSEVSAYLCMVLPPLESLISSTQISRSGL